MKTTHSPVSGSSLANLAEGIEGGRKKRRGRGEGKQREGKGEGRDHFSSEITTSKHTFVAFEDVSFSPKYLLSMSDSFTFTLHHLM